MTRKKVKLAYITDDSARKATFKKRKKGLIKKVEELSILCDIDVCMIICSPYDAQPEVYPSSSGVQRVLARFKNMPEIVQSKKMVNQESFLRNRIAKANEQLEKQREENREKEITRIMFQTLMGAKGLLGLSIVDLKDLRWLIEQKLMNIKMRIERIGGTLAAQNCKPRLMALAAKGKPKSEGESATPVGAVEAARPPRFYASVDGMHRWPQWFMRLINPQE
ncbi:Agamous-like MADS-box protein AGL80 [Morus notabilis]|uniref:Agamous-like MADS-box protein AGL80 n=1 Tax=Morus notabilis TaxID=981085 RepID=W9R2C4_9ROSA|nr:Agamous-like MADS-box protein AGL80 [Morus notabilis]